MNKKILFGSIIAIVILILVSFSGVVGYSCGTSGIKHPASSTIIAYFLICFISGTYETKTSNDKYKLILDSGEGNITMEVKGIALFHEGEASYLMPYKTQAWSIKTNGFIGLSHFGFVFGIGLKKVYVKPEYLPPYH